MQDAGGHDYPIPGGGPLHWICIPLMGMPLLDNTNLGERGEVAAAPAIRGGNGSPVDPLAVF